MSNNHQWQDLSPTGLPSSLPLVLVISCVPHVVLQMGALHDLAFLGMADVDQSSRIVKPEFPVCLIRQLHRAYLKTCSMRCTCKKTTGAVA